MPIKIESDILMPPVFEAVYQKKDSLSLQ